MSGVAVRNIEVKRSRDKRKPASQRRGAFFREQVLAIVLGKHGGAQSYECLARADLAAELMLGTLKASSSVIVSGKDEARPMLERIEMRLGEDWKKWSRAVFPEDEATNTRWNIVFSSAEARKLGLEFTIVLILTSNEHRRRLELVETAAPQASDLAPLREDFPGMPIRVVGCDFPTCVLAQRVNRLDPSAESRIGLLTRIYSYGSMFSPLEQSLWTAERQGKQGWVSLQSIRLFERAVGELELIRNLVRPGSRNDLIDERLDQVAGEFGRRLRDIRNVRDVLAKLADAEFNGRHEIAIKFDDFWSEKRFRIWSFRRSVLEAADPDLPFDDL